MQSQLREQVAKNNAARERIFTLACERMTEQKKDRDVRGAHAELEKVRTPSFYFVRVARLT